jgi:hypothetical protein
VPIEADDHACVWLPLVRVTAPADMTDAELDEAVARDAG